MGKRIEARAGVVHSWWSLRLGHERPTMGARHCWSSGQGSRFTEEATEIRVHARTSASGPRVQVDVHLGAPVGAASAHLADVLWDSELSALSPAVRICDELARNPGCVVVAVNCGAGAVMLGVRDGARFCVEGPNGSETVLARVLVSFAHAWMVSGHVVGAPQEATVWWAGPHLRGR